jgi:hypothetical protein
MGKTTSMQLHQQNASSWLCSDLNLQDNVMDEDEGGNEE